MENKLISGKCANCFEEAYPIGNGHLGAMIYGRCGLDKISLNDDTLWTGKRNDRCRISQVSELFNEIRKTAMEGDCVKAQKLIEEEFLCENDDKYLPVGNLIVKEPDKKIKNYIRTLNLEEGLADVQYTADDCHIQKEYFAAYKRNVIAVRFSANKPGAFSLDLWFETQLKSEDGEFTDNIYITKGRSPVIVNNQYEYGDTSGFFACAVLINVKSGETEYVENKIHIKNADSIELYIKMYSEEYQIENERILRDFAEEFTYSNVKAEHTEYFREMYNRTGFSLSDVSVTRDTEDRIKAFDGEDTGLCELMFNVGKYLIISASQMGSEAMNLQGIWNEELIPPWGSGYTLNINTEMNYWPVQMCNLPECFEPFLTIVKRIAENGKYVAEKLYGVDGFVCHHNSDYAAHTQPVGMGGENAAAYGFWFMGSGWLACQIFDAYEYSLDRELLKKELYPIMKEALKFYLSIMVRDKDGKYILCPSTSPENFYIVQKNRVSVSQYTTMSQSIFMNLAEKVIKSCEILGNDSEFKAEVEEVYKDIRPPQISSDGRILEWAGEQPEEDPHHRHVSHLYLLYPGEQINPLDNNEYCEACKKTLEMRGDGGTGWSLAWKANLWARLLDGEKAYKLLKRQLKLVDPKAECDYGDAGGTYANMFCAHPPFQIDGNLGIMSAIVNMIVQKYDNRIVFLPALPKAWENGKLLGIRLKGNIFADVCWEKGELKSAVLYSSVEQTVKLIYKDCKQTVLLKNSERTEVKF